MRELLNSLAAGEISVSEAEAELNGYVTGDAGRFDAARTGRTGIPEMILAEGKTPEETAALAVLAVETTERAIITRTDAPTANEVEECVIEEHPDAVIEHAERTETIVVYSPAFEPPSLDADIGIVTAGTSDAVPAGEAATIAREMGARVTRIDDVGVAGLARLIDRLDDCRAQDVLIIAAGREGALPTVAAGLVDVPLIGLPVSNGYGYGGDGEAALAGMLQSCTPITVVNIDAGVTAGAQAGLIARALDAARAE
ncbi:nickel pincer cofactor biosynthesis protein LarB [Halocatena marina]|uniref:Nickel pincer cofactor biosynthesis protein LarB n=1 Tax=Halocatena marina TaxID=2934937 RepID=A0ABD5YQT0_9EURY|nr:nickel pincer cofactor biosynthesis protein LarB [Halocatena marina]